MGRGPRSARCWPALLLAGSRSSACCGGPSRTAFDQSEEQNAAFVRHIDEHGGQVLLDARTRRAGSHHQKLVVIRHPGRSDQDVAFVGGIDLGRSRNDDHAPPGRSAGDGLPIVVRARDHRGTTSRRRSAARRCTTSNTPSGSAGTAATCWTSPVRSVSSMTARTTWAPPPHARFPTRSPQTTPHAVRMPSRCCAPTLRGCGGTRSRRWANGASPRRIGRPSLAPGGSSTSRTSTCGHVGSPTLSSVR